MTIVQHSVQPFFYENDGRKFETACQEAIKSKLDIEIF